MLGEIGWNVYKFTIKGWWIKRCASSMYVEHIVIRFSPHVNGVTSLTSSSRSSALHVSYFQHHVNNFSVEIITWMIMMITVHWYRKILHEIAEIWDVCLCLKYIHQQVLKEAAARSVSDLCVEWKRAVNNNFDRLLKFYNKLALRRRFVTVLSYFILYFSLCFILIICSNNMLQCCYMVTQKEFCSASTNIGKVIGT